MRSVALAILVSLGACGDDEIVSGVAPDAEVAPDASAFDTSVILEGSDGDGFGGVVAISGDTIVIGARYTGASAAYVFRRTGSTWTEEAILTPSVPVAGSLFGSSVAISGDTIAVGQSFPLDDGAGAVYVFTRSGSTWTEQARLVSSVSSVGDGFGGVALDGDTLVAGAIALDASTPAKVYVFTRAGTTWTEQTSLTGDPPDFSVSSLAIQDGRIVIGSRYEDNGGGLGSERGGAYVFVGAGAAWTREDKLVSSHTIGQPDFGSSVAIDGDTIALGGPGGGEEKGSGAVAVFVRSGTTWTEEAVLEPSDPVGYGFFFAVALDGDLLAVGAPGVPVDELADAGAVYLFTRAGSTWAERVRLVSPSPSELGRFTYPALSADTLVIGEPGDDRVHVYAR